MLQWNTSSLISHWAEFREYIVNKKPLLAAIQETRFLDSDLDKYRLTPFGYSLYCDNVNDSPRRGGAALYVSNNLLHHQIHFNTPLNYVAINAKIAQREINIVSIYLSPSQVITSAQLDHFFRQIPHPCLILGDFNAQHTAWGCHANNSRGQTLHTLLDQHHLAFLNDTTPTHHCVRRNQVCFSVIDLSLASPQIATIFTSQVQSDPLFSDHYPIHLNLEVSSESSNLTFIPRWNFKHANWTAFQQYIDDKHPINSEPNIEAFLNNMLESAHQNIPQTRPRTNKNHAPWWNSECRRAVAIRRRALRAFQRCICAEHEKAAREARAHAYEIILKAKRDSWEKFSNTFNRFTPLSKIWKILRCFSNKRSPIYKIPHLVINNQHHSTPLDVATQFAAHYAQVSSNINYTEQTQNTLNATLSTCHFNSNNTEHYNQLFTLHELRLAISKSGNTSVGPDQIAYPFFKNLTESGLVNLLSALNQLWEDGSFPDSWTSSTLIPILKSRKPTADPASYRPISLSSCASKILERMVNGRLRAYLETNNIISPFQSGFRPGRSTADNLIYITDSVQRGFQNQNITAALFLDLKAAFDKVNHSALLIKMHKVGVRGRLAKYITNFINNRTFSVRCGKTYSEPVIQEHGVPQGSPLSPTLFIILINDIFNELHNVSSQLKYSMYADDLAVWITHSSVDTATDILQVALNHIDHWCCQWGVQISPAKSEYIVFSHKHNHIEPLQPLNVNGQIIPLVHTIKYLGITLDRRLTYNHHVADLQQRCSRRLNILKCIAGREWGADRSTLLRLYTSLIRPILDYNAFLFGNISSTLVGKLESIQNNALRLVTGAFRTTPATNLRVDTNIPPLIRRRELHLIRYYARSAARPTEQPFQILTHLPTNRNLTIYQRRYPTISLQIKRVFEDYNIQPPSIYPIPPARLYWVDRNIDCNFLFSNRKADIHPTEVQHIFFEFQQQHTTFSFIYTDGSRVETRTGARIGAAFVVGNYTQSYRLSDFHSIYSAELSAILSALRYVKNKNINAIICTDSRAAISALCSPYNSSHPILHHIRDMINSIQTEIKLLWIPGHTGIPGNEKADLAAKASLQDPPANHIHCPSQDFIKAIHTNYKSSLQFDWDANPHFHYHLIKPVLGHWSTSNQNNRRKEIILARLRMGHTNLTHIYIIESSPPPNCHRCNCRYTIEHFLLHCPLYNTERQPIIRHAAANRLPLTLPVLLGDSHPDLLDLLFEFLHNTRLELSI